MNGDRAYHASRVQGGKPWHRFLSKVLTKVNDIVTIASEMQGHGESREHGKVPICLFLTIIRMESEALTQLCRLSQ